MTDDGFVTLICPPGAEQGAISQGATSWEPWHDHASGKWLVRVPSEVARHFTWNAGFYLAPPELQSKQEGL
jgi:predicted phosphoadenosine phosphosulfate sulfurtransferase